MLIPAETASKGLVLIRGTGAANIGAEVSGGTAEVRLDRDRDAFVIMAEAAEPPSVLGCELRWAPGARISMELPFPARGGRFIGADGNVLPNGAEVSMERLSGVRAEAVYADQHGRFVVTGQMHASDIPSTLFHELRVGRELREEFTGHAALALHDIDDSLRLMLALTEDLDATFRLRVEASTGKHVPPRVLNIKRFDGSLWWEKEQALVSIRTSNLSAAELDNLRLEARPLWDPEIDPEILNQTGPELGVLIPPRTRPVPG